ncbi:DNA-methyltransferase [Paenibacillus odorifer]|uniref:Methyltransferase n=1 Tax=Paenibacillus odorifer TaxID=189426 RepID=A0A1R0XQY2_9BACL|nr:site-specific DNA-methyltransferase [Paenibacillus odorifer]OMD37524.1 site-specific DNA-methyltransferase [Paenibacillus odorifer]
MKKVLGSFELNRIQQRNCIIGMSFLPGNCIDLVIADPPYNIGREGAKVNLKKGYKAINESWDNIEDYETFTTHWLRECYRVLKPGGSILCYGSHHSIFITGYVMRQLGFKVKTQYVWRKKNPPPSFLGTNPTYATEFIIWATKPDGLTTYNLDYAKAINEGKNIHNILETALTPKREKTYGKFPCQKPLQLAVKLIQLHSNINDTILIPFCGSGTEAVASVVTNRSFISFETNREYIELANNRLDDISMQEDLIDSKLLNPLQKGQDKKENL